MAGPGGTGVQHPYTSRPLAHTRAQGIVAQCGEKFGGNCAGRLNTLLRRGAECSGPGSAASVAAASAADLRPRPKKEKKTRNKACRSYPPLWWHRGATDSCARALPPPPDSHALEQHLPNNTTDLSEHKKVTYK